VRGAVITFTLVGATHDGYRWEHSAPLGSSETLSDPSAASVTLTPDVAGDAWLVVLEGLNAQGIVEASYLLPLSIPATELAMYPGPLALAYLHPASVDIPTIGQVLYQDWSQGGAVSLKDAAGVTRQLAVLRSGASDARPSGSSLAIGTPYFDTTLGYTVTWNGTVWVNHAGATV
jgi:hypothetical protein